jgi:hypothetical protein
MIDPADPVFKIDALGAAGILHVIGDTGNGRAARFDAAIARLAARHGGAIFIAFGECTFADAETLRILARRSQDLGTRLRLVAPRGAYVRELAWSTSSSLNFYDAFEDAVSAPMLTPLGMLSSVTAAPEVPRAAR